MPTATTPDLDAITTDLTKLLEQARWAANLAYGKAGRGLDAERGAVHRAPTPDEAAERRKNPDHVRGSRYELDIGDHKSRVAYQAAVRAVTTVDVYLAASLRAEGVTSQPPLRPLDRYSTPAALTVVATNATWRAEQLAPHQARHRRRLRHLRTLLDERVRAFSAALDVGKAEGIAHAEKPCRTCKARPQAVKENKKGQVAPAQSGECDTCAQWRKRNRGQPRPVSIDGTAEAKAAQARRRARGEDFGAA
ncbi:hypothetical protein [Iamia sp.]|uniref:hypothetical protein n=1 Tax=Iamia sp. TaxID=2722710 RepID=UPI002CF7CB5C|nr:hypothetical protein [Iamia sp.]HXH58452.1 hypothetical protein [Iamia sp.]